MFSSVSDTHTPVVLIKILPYFCRKGLYHWLVELFTVWVDVAEIFTRYTHLI